MTAGDRSFDFDALEIWRCPQLGNPVTFKYCRVMNGGSLCPRIVSCWGGTIDVMRCLRSYMSDEAIDEAVGAGSKDRLTRIVETLDDVSKRPPQE